MKISALKFTAVTLILAIGVSLATGIIPPSLPRIKNHEFLNGCYKSLDGPNIFIQGSRITIGQIGIHPLISEVIRDKISIALSINPEFILRKESDGQYKFYQLSKNNTLFRYYDKPESSLKLTASDGTEVVFLRGGC